MLLGEEFKEFATSKNSNELISSTWTEQKQAYYEVHKNMVTRNVMKPIFKYINYRFNQHVNFENLTSIMMRKNELYKKSSNLSYIATVEMNMKQ